MEEDELQKEVRKVMRNKHNSFFFFFGWVGGAERSSLLNTTNGMIATR